MRNNWVRAVGEQAVGSMCRYIVAVATLLSLASNAWSAGPYQVSPAVASDAEAEGMTQPSLNSPKQVEGAWVSDNGGASAPGPSLNAAPAPRGPYQQRTGAAYGGAAGLLAEELGPAGGGDGGCPDGSCGPDGCGPGGCGPGCSGGYCGPFGHDPRDFHGHHGQLNGLWADVHAHRRIYVQGDYLSFWAKGNPLPPLVTTSPPGTPQTAAGVLPESATTSILFGNERVDLNQRNGARINVGYWLVDGEFCGIEGQYFALEQQNTNYSAFSTGDPILARPFVDVGPSVAFPTNASALVAFPGFQTPLGGTGNLEGGINIHTTSNIQSGGALYRRLVWIDFDKQCRMDIIMGYRFFRLDDSVTINDDFTFFPTSGPQAETNFVSQDIFSAKNVFNGGEIGLKWYQYFCGRFSLELIGKCAFGNNREKMYINGSNTITSLGQSVPSVGGFLTQPSNIGNYTRDVFAVLPEFNANLRVDITRNLRATMGYTFIYMNRVQRSGDAINLNLNPTQLNGGTLVGAAEPSFAFNDTTFWVHGVNGGFEYRY